MKPRTFLVLMTAVAVVSDSMLHPFYPQYFAQAFGVTDSLHIGLYIATCSLLVLVCFPLWAQLGRRVPVMQLLIWTQIGSGVFSVWAGSVDSLGWFWSLSLAMIVFKASYLLIYPYLMSLETKENHIGTIGLLAFVVYFANILAALLGGTVLEWFAPRRLFQLMALGDVVQVLLCWYWLRVAPAAPAAEATAPNPVPFSFVARLGGVMLVLYFSAYVSEPFFAVYWESLVGSDNKMLSGLVFAIPGIAALAGLYVNQRRGEANLGVYSGIVPAIALGVLGLSMQASGFIWLVLCGRFLYGWSLFQAMVRLDRILFRESTPETYATDFSLVNLFQGLGILLASTSAGSLVGSFGMTVPFWIAVFGFTVSAVLHSLLFREHLGESAGPSEAATHPNQGTLT